MGDPRTGEIYELGEGQEPKPGDVKLEKAHADELRKLDKAHVMEKLKQIAAQQQTPEMGKCEINDNLTNVKVILWEMIGALQKSALKSRERSLVITKLQEARMWASEAQWNDDERQDSKPAR